MNKFVLILLVIVFTFLTASIQSVHSSFNSIPSSKQASVPRFETAPCAIEVPESEKQNVRCGYLVVLENRNRKTSRLIKLPIVILRSNNPNPAPDPILRMLGGPGASSLRLVRSRRSSPWLENRDVVIFEQRGTSYAQPKLDCPEVNAAILSNARANAEAKTAIKREASAAKQCRNRLEKEGIDLSAYDSAQSAADIEDLRKTLGYDKWNLYGVSYSSRLMLNVMRDYPAGIRSVVLESVLPPSVNYDEVGVNGALRALKVVFANCAADTECDTAYPNLERVFYEVVRRANVKPITFSVKLPNSGETFTVNLNGNDVTDWVLDYLLSADAEAIADAPLQIYRFSRGNFSALKSYAESKVSQASPYSLGMRFSVWCREEMPFENRRKIASQSENPDGLRGYSIQGYMPAVCDEWDVQPARSIENQPVTSNIPTLVLGAEYDAYTPPDWGRLTAQTLPNSFFFEIPGVGHGPGFSSACSRQMIAAFFDNPSKPPNNDCLNAPRKRFTIDK